MQESRLDLEIARVKVFILKDVSKNFVSIYEFFLEEEKIPEILDNLISQLTSSEMV